MEEWNKGNKMIREIGSKEDPHAYTKQSRERIMAMEALSSTHIVWYTHKNPYGCWICDMIQMMYALIGSFEQFLGPEPEEQDTEPERLE